MFLYRVHSETRSEERMKGTCRTKESNGRKKEIFIRDVNWERKLVNVIIMCQEKKLVSEKGTGILLMSLRYLCLTLGER